MIKSSKPVSASSYRKRSFKKRKKTYIPKSIKYDSPELKCRDYQTAGFGLGSYGVSGATLGDTWTTSTATIGTMINAIAQGTSVAQRVGNKIKIHSIRFKCGFETTMTILSVTANNVVRCRLLIILDRYPNKAYPQIDTVFEQYQDSSVTGFTQFSNNTALGNRFKVLRDKTFKMDINQQAGTEFVDEYIKFKTPIIMSYEGSASSIANVKENAIYAIIFTDDPSPTDVSTFITSVNARMRYTDA